MVELTPDQIQRLRKPYDKLGAFKGCSDEEVKQLLREMMEIWLTLANISLRLQREEQQKYESTRN